ncbi:MAG: methyltransferase [Flavobacteriaceae bacterium]|nr:methyltransferase [Flavobacteriaceae bacterium]
MKIGTDGVLLGAWANLEHQPFSILDIGAGTGVVALMLAQRSHAEVVDALEIDDEAYEQASENFEASPWNDRLFCYHAGFLEFVQEIDDEYDLIVSNPPFFNPSLSTSSLQKSENSISKAREMARFNDALPFEHLLAGTANLLSREGKACFIIPFQEEQKFLFIAAAVGLFPNKITHVKGTPTSEIKRSLLELSFTRSDVFNTELVIETDRHVYTPEYVGLTKDFYLKM